MYFEIDKMFKFIQPDYDEIGENGFVVTTYRVVKIMHSSILVENEECGLIIELKYSDLKSDTNKVEFI